jgi:hypothetical protein
VAAGAWNAQTHERLVALAFCGAIFCNQLPSFISVQPWLPWKEFSFHYPHDPCKHNRISHPTQIYLSKSRVLVERRSTQPQAAPSVTKQNSMSDAHGALYALHCSHHRCWEGSAPARHDTRTRRQAVPACLVGSWSVEHPYTYKKHTKQETGPTS